jgi:hypothetical protein
MRGGSGIRYQARYPTVGSLPTELPFGDYDKLMDVLEG